MIEIATSETESADGLLRKAWRHSGSSCGTSTPRSLNQPRPVLDIQFHGEAVGLGPVHAHATWHRTEIAVGRSRRHGAGGSHDRPAAGPGAILPRPRRPGRTGRRGCPVSCRRPIPRRSRAGVAASGSRGTDRRPARPSRAAAAIDQHFDFGPVRRRGDGDRPIDRESRPGGRGPDMPVSCRLERFGPNTERSRFPACRDRRRIRRR